MKQNKQNSNDLMNGLYMQYTILQKNKQGGGGGEVWGYGISRGVEEIASGISKG